MKTAFSILPANSSDNYDLLIEAGRDCICLLWYKEASQQLDGLVVYQPEENAGDTGIADQLQQVLASQALPHYNTVRIFLNLKESVLLPNHLQYNAGKEELLNLMYGNRASATMAQDSVDYLGALNLYRTPTSLKNTLADRFYGASFKHSTSCQLKAAREHNLYCIVYPGSVKIILHVNEQLQLAQLYDYSSPSDVSYYLLQACQQHGLQPADASLRIAGFIDKDSQLYQEIYRYFLNIELLDIPKGIGVSDAMQELPVQFYSFLIPLLQCGS